MGKKKKQSIVTKKINIINTTQIQLVPIIAINSDYYLNLTINLHVYYKFVLIFNQYF